MVSNASGTDLNLAFPYVMGSPFIFYILLGVGLLKKGTPELVCVGRMDEDELAVISRE